MARNKTRTGTFNRNKMIQYLEPVPDCFLPVWFSYNLLVRDYQPILLYQKLD